MTDGDANTPERNPSERNIPDRAHPRHPPDEALEVETYVEHDRGRWVVSVVVVFADEVVRTTINSYHTERMATLAASWIKRAARRDAAIARPSNVVPAPSEQKDPPA